MCVQKSNDVDLLGESGYEVGSYAQDSDVFGFASRLGGGNGGGGGRCYSVVPSGPLHWTALVLLEFEPNDTPSLTSCVCAKTN